MSYLPSFEATRVDLTIGQTIHLKFDDEPWTVRAVSDNFAACTRLVSQTDYDQEEFRSDPDDRFWENPCTVGEVMYTVLDWRNGVRGPCNLIGQSWGDGTYSEAECAAMLAEFEAGDLEVSSRNFVRLEVADR